MEKLVGKVEEQQPKIVLNFEEKFNIFSAKVKFQRDLRKVAVKELIDIIGTDLLSLKDH